VVGVGDDEGPVGEDQLDLHDVVERQPERSGQRPVAAAQGEPDHTHGADRADHGREPGALGRGDDLPAGGAAGEVGGAAGRIDGDVVHRRQVQHQPAVDDRCARPAVAPAPDRDGHAHRGRGAHPRLHVSDAGAAQHERRAVPDSAVPQRPGRGQAGIGAWVGLGRMHPFGCRRRPQGQRERLGGVTAHRCSSLRCCLASLSDLRESVHVSE
jgi:hypothetical protein